MTPAPGRARQKLVSSGLVALGLLAATLGVLWPLGLTNRILAGIDAFTYFLPYWSYRMAALRAWVLPLWNPYLFLGAPFLANPQAAVLYPLHWPLSWLRPEQALVWSAIIHVWLAGMFTYLLARRSFRLSLPASLLPAFVFALGGFTVGRVENINQLNALAWLPALLLCYDTLASPRSPARGRLAFILPGAAFALVIAMQVLAGHTQTAFINFAGVGLYALWPLLQAAIRREPRGALLPLLRRRATPFVWLVPGLLLCAAQLLPTFELNGLGLRTGGLSYRQAVSFSLQPRLLLQSLLPPGRDGLAQAFGSEGYAEFVAYVGIVPLLLAALAMLGVISKNRIRCHSERREQSRLGSSHPERRISSSRRRDPSLESRRHIPWLRAPLRVTDNPEAPSRPRSAMVPPALGPSRDGSPPLGGAAFLAAAGAFLALGAYNPVYWLLWRIVPGFDLFRAPVRWLALFVIGIALLAGAGLDHLRSQATGAIRPALPGSRRRRLAWAAGGLVLVALLAVQRFPDRRTLATWAFAAIAAGVLVMASRRSPRWASVGLIALALAELWLGARAMPLADATAPYAASLRTAPAALLAASDGEPPAGRGRFLSLSDIRFDPGDLAELRALQQDRLPADAIERMVRAAKQVEVLAPNLPLQYGLPAVDGYDGGILPLSRYVRLLGLFLPPDQLVPDGRLREQLAEIPPARLLDLTGVRFVITDKQRDLWHDDIYYDLQSPVTLLPGESIAFDLTQQPEFPANALGLVLKLEGAGTGGGAEVVAAYSGGISETLSLPASDGEVPVRVPLRSDGALTSLTFHCRSGAAQPFTLLGASLIDTRTGTHTTVTVSPGGALRRIHSGDVKVYERTGSPGRAWLVHGVEPVAGDAAALSRLGQDDFDPRAAVLLNAPIMAREPGRREAGESVELLAFEPELIRLRVTAAAPAALVLADAFYPGWEAQIDGAPVALLRANLHFRAVMVESGTHEIEMRYSPTVWRAGVLISLATLGLLLVAAVAARYNGGADSGLREGVVR